MKTLLCLIRVPVRNKEKWIEIIKSSYPEGAQLTSSRILVCDLHFAANDFQRQGERTVLVNNAVPILSFDLNEDNQSEPTATKNNEKDIYVMEEQFAMMNILCNESNSTDEDNQDIK